MKDRENRLVKAGVAGSTAEAAQMLNFLSRHEIAASAEAGSLKVYEGNSPSGQAILVEELLRGFTPIRTYAFRREGGQAILGRWGGRVLAGFCLFFLLLPLFLLFVKQLF